MAWFRQQSTPYSVKTTINKYITSQGAVSGEQWAEYIGRALQMEINVNTLREGEAGVQFFLSPKSETKIPT